MKFNRVAEFKSKAAIMQFHAETPADGYCSYGPDRDRTYVAYRIAKNDLAYEPGQRDFITGEYTTNPETLRPSREDTKMTDQDIVKRHTRLLREVPLGSVFYSIAKKSRNSVVTGCKFFLALTPNEIDDVTAQVASVTGSKWDTKTGFMRTTAIADAIDLLGIRLYDNPTAFAHKSL